MDKKEKVISFIRKKGPSIPGWINKELELDILMTSALLSEMVSEGLLKVSHVKIGGSPLYYLKGQESALVNYIDKLHEKEKRAVLKLKENKVIRDKTAEPLIRVALRHSKDFAKPFTVNIDNKKEIFWKWYLLKDNDFVRKKIYDIIGKKKNKIKKKKETKEKQKTKKQDKKETEQKKDKIELKGNISQEFKKMDIEVLTKEVVRKNKEFDMEITLPSSVGRLRYFCKYINKKRINDKDLSSAFVKGQLKKMPVLVFITGDLTKKAEKIADEMKGINIKKISS
jgi:hypothetical protein